MGVPAQARQRARFFELADAFLSSGLVPAYTAAAFAKRFARLALTAPPAGTPCPHLPWQNVSCDSQCQHYSQVSQASTKAQSANAVEQRATGTRTHASPALLLSALQQSEEGCIFF